MKTQVENITRPGDNHTGITLHPEAALVMVQGTTEFGPTSSGGPEAIAKNRIRVARQSEPVATMPPKSEVTVEMLPLLDKLGARLAFERTGVRLYEALISKHDAYGSFTGGPTRADLEHIREEELQHLRLVQQVVLGLGGDPTVVTPCANLQATASRGIGDVLVDPRTTLVECLDVMLIAELTDHASWENLAATARLAGQAALEPKIREAARVEAEHLVKVRNWLTEAGKLAARPVD